MNQFQWGKIQNSRKALREFLPWRQRLMAWLICYCPKIKSYRFDCSLLTPNFFRLYTSFEQFTASCIKKGQWFSIFDKIWLHWLHLANRLSKLFLKTRTIVAFIKEVNSYISVTMKENVMSSGNSEDILTLLTANPTKWANTLKQFTEELFDCVWPFCGVDD